MAKKLTIFQRLNTVLGATKGSEPSYVIDPKSFANLDASELQQKKLEAQQTFFLQNQWKKIDNELYQKAVYYEPTRMHSYYDYEAMEYSISADTKIATPDGFITIKELADKGRDYEFITYAYDHNLKKVVPAKAKNAHYTRDEMTHKITFDDGSHIIATYGHRFLKRNGIFCEVENLKVGDSMMPFYRKSFYNNQKYNWVYTCNSNEGYNGWVAEHNLIAEWFYRTINENEEVHHIDFNGKNNNPENLKIWDISEHRGYHAKLNNKKLWSNPDYRAKMLEVSKRTDNKHRWNGERSGKNNPAYIKLPFDNIVESAKINRTLFKTAKSLNISYKKIQKELKFNGFKNWFDFLDVYNIPKYVPGVEDRGALNFNVIPWDLLIEVAKSKKTMEATSDYLGIGLPKLRSTIRSGGFNNWTTFLSAYGITGGKPGRKKITEDIVVNHKIVSIEPHGVIPVYDLTVPGYKNFATDTIFSHNTPEISVALDIFADEATTSNESGRILTVYSESTRIKNELINLFDNVLDINTNLTAWARNLCKYGDNFVYNKIVPKKGIVGCLQLPNVEITRTEPGFTPVKSIDAYNDEISTFFSWKDKNIEFNSFEVSHFRLTGDDRKLPYGTCLKYDTRVDVENGVKEIKDIQIGDKVWSFDIKTQKRVLSPVLDVINSKFKINYAINTKHNFIEASEEHRIMIFNGNDFIYKNVLDINIGDLLVINKNVVNSENNSYNNQMIKYDNPNRISDEYILEPVTKIVETGNFETYDIYVENENHNFYANGIVVHNSMLEKVRRIWKQLLLSEDAMLVYRVTRAPERRVYKVFVGNMDDKDVDGYVDKIANNFKRTNVVNSDNGQQDTRYNALAVDQDYFIPVRDPGLAMPIETLPGACLDLNTKIPLLDGRILSLNEIIYEWESGNRNLWVYSCNPNTGALAPGMITWAGVTRKNTDVIKITLDNGKEIITTPDHKFVHRTKGFVEAKDLVVSDSLMPFYKREKQIKKNTNKYEQIWDSEKSEWIFTHRMVVNFLKDYDLINEFVFDEKYTNIDKKIIHHKNHNRYDNNVDNLLLMNSVDHIKYHQSVIKETIWGNPELNKEKISKGLKKYLNNLSEEEFNERMERINNPETKLKTTIKLLEWNKDENNLKLKGKKISEAYSVERKEKISNITKDYWKDDDYRNRVFSKKQTITFDVYIYNTFVSVFEKSLRADITLEVLNSNDEFMNHFKNINSDIRSGITNLNKFTLNHVNKMVKEQGFSNFSEWKKSQCKSNGFINIRQWKYNVDKVSNYNHKIVKIEWLGSKMDTGTITVDGNELYHNYHTFALESGVFVKNSNLSEIADIEYIQKKMLAALRVPKAFLGFDESTGDGKNLAILDIRFARAVHRVQKALIQELNKMAIIHLYLKGYEDDLDNFTLSLTTPSTQAEILKVENWKEKIQLYKDAVTDAGNGYGATSMTFAKKEILGMSEDEIKLDIQRQAVEKAGGEEIKMLAETIKQTGMFREIYKAYKINPENMSAGEQQPTDGGAESGGSFGGGGDLGGDLGGDFGGDLGAEGGGDDLATDFTTPLEEPEPLSETVKKNNKKRRNNITERLNKTINDLDKLINE